MRFNSSLDQIQSGVHAEKIRTAIDSGRGNLVLDAGCGSGSTSIALAENGFTVIGCDVSAWVCKQAQGRSKEATSKVSVCTASLTELPFETESFDTIICLDVLEHIKKTRRALLELVRTLKPNGVLIIAIPGLAHHLIYDRILIRNRLAGAILRKLGLLDRVGVGHFHEKRVDVAMIRSIECKGLIMRRIQNIAFVSTYLETLGHLIEFVSERKIQYFRQVAKLDSRFAAHLPLAFGSSWLMIFSKKN